MDDLLIAVRAIVSLGAVLGLLLWVTHSVKKRQLSGGGIGPSLPKSLGRLAALIPSGSSRSATASPTDPVTTLGAAGTRASARAAAKANARDLARANRPEKITVVARAGLSGKAQLVVAEFSGIRYVLGVTEHGVSVVDTQEPTSSWDVSLVESADTSEVSGVRVGSVLKPVA